MNWLENSRDIKV